MGGCKSYIQFVHFCSCPHLPLHGERIRREDDTFGLRATEDILFALCATERHRMIMGPGRPDLSNRLFQQLKNFCLPMAKPASDTPNYPLDEILAFL